MTTYPKPVQTPYPSIKPTHTPGLPATIPGVPAPRPGIGPLKPNPSHPGYPDKYRSGR